MSEQISYTTLRYIDNKYTEVTVTETKGGGTKSLFFGLVTMWFMYSVATKGITVHVDSPCPQTPSVSAYKGGVTK